MYRENWQVSVVVLADGLCYLEPSILVESNCMKVETNGVRVQQLRHAKGLTQQQLADKADIKDRTLQRIESGEGARRQYVGAVAAALDVPAEDILALSDEDGPPSAVPGGKWPVKLNRVTSGKKLLDLLLWANRLKFEHDLDPDFRLAQRMTEFIENCGKIESDNVHLEQIDTDFAIAAVTQELDRIGNLNSYLELLSGQGAHVYAGAYTHRYVLPASPPIPEIPATVDPATGERVGPVMLEFILLIHLLKRDVPSVTAHVERGAKDEFLDKNTSDEQIGDPRTFKPVSKLPQGTDDDGPEVTKADPIEEVFELLNKTRKKETPE